MQNENTKRVWLYARPIDTTNSQIQQKILRFRKRIRPLADTSVYSIL